MRDEHIVTAASLSDAESAVNYLLQRLRVDPDLRWHMMSTEAYARLCHAEAVRTGKSEEEIRKFYSVLADHCRHEKPRLVRCREAIEDALRLFREHELDVLFPWGEKVMDDLQRAC